MLVFLQVQLPSAKHSARRQEALLASIQNNNNNNKTHRIINRKEATSSKGKSKEFTMKEALTKERLDEVVAAVKETLRDPDMRKLNQRGVQAKIWHSQPAVARVLSDLRLEEEAVATRLMKAVSYMVYEFHEISVDATLARAGITEDERVHAGSSLNKKEEFDLFCLDGKERLYLIMKQYGWLKNFFRAYPHHFYENSFQFVDRIPEKKLKVKVKVVGLGIGGSMAVSGLAKLGIDSVVGYEKRDASGPRSVGTRYQNGKQTSFCILCVDNQHLCKKNTTIHAMLLSTYVCCLASWRAYDVAEALLDEEAYNHLIEYRQRINVTNDDGSTNVITSDRVQIILGSAIEEAQASAKRYGAMLNYGVDTNDYFDTPNQDQVDIVALFAGAHTAKLFPGLDEKMKIFQWDDITSSCIMWLSISPSEKKDFYCARRGEVGAEHWHYTIESARNTRQDITRVKNALESQRSNALKMLMGEEKKEWERKYSCHVAQLNKVQKYMEEIPEGRFDYVFTNAPLNAHNQAKRDRAYADGNVVLEGGYKVDVAFACHATITGGELVDKFKTSVVVLGGDACVPPNPQAAYGATLACESAYMVVQLAFAFGHLNAILEVMDDFSARNKPEWKNKIEELKALFAEYYEARSRSENYFQWVQTLICNIYSLPPMQ